MKYMYVNYSTLQVCNKRFCYIHMHNVHHKFVMVVHSWLFLQLNNTMHVSTFMGLTHRKTNVSSM